MIPPQISRLGATQAKNRTEMLARLDLDEPEVNALLGYLFSQGILIKLNDESFFHHKSVDRAISLLQNEFHNNEFSLAEFRDALGSARKAVQALLEYFDAQKYTMRKGDVRVVWKLPEDSQ